MNSLIFLVFCTAALYAGYRIYGTAFERFLGTDHSRKTPAHTKFDGVDYVPVKHWLVLFGHHFSAIAGAGPVIGPVIAVGLWGWGPAVGFVLVGMILIGGIHDMGSLFLSVRHEGKSVANISEDIISKRARLIFSWFVLLSLVVVVAVFVYFCADTMVIEPKIVVPSIGLIPVAFLVGILMYRTRMGTPLSTVIGLALMVALIFLGQAMPVTLDKSYAMFIWVVVLLAYCFLASVLPVNILLQPRDYLCSYLLFFGVAVGFLGIFTSRPDILTPPFVKWSDAKEGPLWPMLFVIIACGAISGFHSLVSAGTSSKQISSEKDIKRIGYGAMAVEALVAVMAITAVTTAFGSASELSASINVTGPVNTFSHGFGYITRFILGGYGAFIAIILLNSFILTTLDAATRIARYLLQEMFTTLDRFLATALIILAGGYLALSGSWQKVWPIFGAANQLTAALTMIVLSSWLLSRGKDVRITLIPAIFMLVTSVGALGWQFGKFLGGGDYFLIVVDTVLMALALSMLIEVRSHILSLARGKRGSRG